MGRSRVITASGSSAGARELERFIDAPAEGWPSGLYRTVTGGVFPTAVTWWTDNTATVKIMETLYTRNGSQQATTIEHKIYAPDGTTVLKTVTDTVTYSGAAETSRTRTIV